MRKADCGKKKAREGDERSLTRVAPLEGFGPGFELDPYDGLPVGAERPMTHAPDDVCRFAAPHPRAECRHLHPAKQLEDVPAALLATEDDLPF